MFKSKTAILGIAAAVVASVLLVSGLAVTTTTGAATDIPANIGVPGSLTPPDNSTTPSNPPASPIESPVTNGTQPTTNPAGNQAGAGALPNAGYGPGGTARAFGSLTIVLGIAGLILAGAGATVASSRRQ